MYGNYARPQALWQEQARPESRFNARGTFAF